MNAQKNRPAKRRALAKFVSRIAKLTAQNKLWDIRDKMCENYWDRWFQLLVEFRGHKLVIKVEHSVDRCDTSENFDGTQRVDSDARYYERILVLDDDTREELFQTSRGAHNLWLFLEKARRQGLIPK